MYAENAERTSIEGGESGCDIARRTYFLADFRNLSPSTDAFSPTAI